MTLEKKLEELIKAGDLTEHGAEEVKTFIFSLLTVEQSKIKRDIEYFLSQRIPRIT